MPVTRIYARRERRRDQNQVIYRSNSAPFRLKPWARPWCNPNWWISEPPRLSHNGLSQATSAPRISLRREERTRNDIAVGSGSESFR